MTISKWRHFLVLLALVYLASYTKAYTGFSRTISLFYYCGAMLPISSQERYIIEIYGNRFPVSKKSCHVKFYELEPSKTLLYKVTSALVNTLGEEISVDSSKDGREYQSEEFITVSSPPRDLNEEMESQRSINVSAYRVSGYVLSRFSVRIQIYADDYYDRSVDDKTSVPSSSIVGIVMGIALAFVVFGCVIFYIRKTRCERIYRSRQQDQSTTTSRSAATDQQTDIPIQSFIPGGHHPGPDAFLPPYSPEPDNNIFTVQSYSSSEPPPSYEEVMKSGLREVTL